MSGYRWLVLYASADGSRVVYEVIVAGDVDDAATVAATMLANERLGAGAAWRVAGVVRESDVAAVAAQLEACS